MPRKRQPDSDTQPTEPTEPNPYHPEPQEEEDTTMKTAAAPAPGRSSRSASIAPPFHRRQRKPESALDRLAQHGPPLVGEPLINPQVVETLASEYGVEVAATTITSACGHYRQRIQAEAARASRVEDVDTTPRRTELKCQWMGQRPSPRVLTRQRVGTYLIDGDPANLARYAEHQRTQHEQFQRRQQAIQVRGRPPRLVDAHAAGYKTMAEIAAEAGVSEYHVRMIATDHAIARQIVGQDTRPAISPEGVERISQIIQQRASQARSAVKHRAPTKTPGLHTYEEVALQVGESAAWVATVAKHLGIRPTLVGDFHKRLSDADQARILAYAEQRHQVQEAREQARQSDRGN